MSLPKSPDDVVTALLARALLFLTHATQHSRLNSPLDRMVAIHGLDNSVEYLLRIVIKHLDMEAVTGKNIDAVELAALAGEVNRFLKTTYSIELPYLSEIKQIRQVRNLVQHGVVDPQPDLPRYRAIVERFFTRVLSSIFGIDRGTLRVSSLVENSQVRDFLEKSEILLDQKQYLESIVASRDAFENARHERTKFSSLRISLLPALIESKGDRPNLYYFLDTVAEEIEATSLDIDIQAYRRFKEYMRHIPSEHCAKGGSGGVIMQRPWNEQDARFCYDFASSSVLLWQNGKAERLYPLRIVNKYEWEIEIGSVVIPQGTEHGVMHILENNREMDVYFVSCAVKDALIVISPETSVLVKGKVFKDGILDRKYSYDITLISTYARLVTNNPELWEVITWSENTSRVTAETFGEDTEPPQDAS